MKHLYVIISFETREKQYMHLQPIEKNNKYSITQKKRVLTKALINLVDRLHLSRQETSAILGPSESSLSRIFSKSHSYIDPESKEGQLTLLLLRMYRNLDTLFGGNEIQCQLWLRNENSHLNGIPIQLIQSIEGLVLTDLAPKKRTLN
jgi:hypothetical protein